MGEAPGLDDNSTIAALRGVLTAGGDGAAADDAPPPNAADIAAAVLVPILTAPLDGDGDGATILFTKRTAHLAHHAGQISFPGGRLENDDPDPVAAALRESAEEIGLPARRVDVLGVLAPRSTRTGFRITPVIGLIDGPFAPRPDPHEVAQVFDVPLAFLMNPANHATVTRTVDGVIRKSWAMPYREHYIWGATAGILKSLSLLLTPLDERP